jgi:putative oxidoreductase
MLNACYRFAPLPLRLVFGAALAYHGFPKLFSAEGHASFRKIMETSGVPNPELAAWLVGLLEFGGGLGIFFGLFVRGLALALFVELAINLGIAATRGSFAPPQAGGQPLPDYESSLLYMGALLSLIITGK